jgi:hypothetical protein
MVNEPSTSNPPSGKKRVSHRRKQIYLQIIVGIIILSCGIVIGSGATLLHLKDRMIMRGPRPPLNSIVEDIRARYDLTEEQSAQAEDILRKRQETMHTLFGEFREKIEAEFQELSMEMKEILSPEQYERWEHDFKTRRGPGPWGPGPGRPGQRGPGRRGSGRGGTGRRGPGPRRPGFPEPNSKPE